MSDQNVLRDSSKFSALCYHSTSGQFNREVLCGEGDPSWTSMTMFCMPPGKSDKDKKEFEQTIEEVADAAGDAWPGVRPRKYANDRGLGRMDKRLSAWSVTIRANVFFFSHHPVENVRCQWRWRWLRTLAP
jgi:hypothetical protein